MINKVGGKPTLRDSKPDPNTAEIKSVRRDVDHLTGEVERMTPHPFGGWEFVSVDFLQADTDTGIPHSIKSFSPDDIRYIVLDRGTDVTVYRGPDREWLPGIIWLRASTPAQIRLLLFTDKHIAGGKVKSTSLPTECCDENQVGGTECAIQCTTVPLQTFPSAANGVTLTPTGVAWTNTGWEELIASASEDLILASILMLAGTTANDNFFEVDIGTGSAGNEVVVATMQGLSAANASAVGSPLTLPIPAFLIDSGERVSIRLRQANTDTTDWRGAIQCYSKTDYDAEGLSYAISGPEVWPQTSSKTSVNPNGSSWVNSNWHQIVASTGSDWVVGQLLAHGLGTNVDWEVDIGIGQSGQEVVLTTIRAKNDRFFVTSVQQGGFFVYNIRPLLDAIPSGSRVAVRLRKGDTDTNPWTMALTFYREHVPSFTTSQAQLVVPSGAAPIDLTAHATAGQFGSWVEFIASTTSDIAITSIIPGQGSRQIVEIGIGSAGNEVAIGQWTFGGNNGDAYQAHLPIALKISAGERVSMRLATTPTGGQTKNYAFTYIEAPTFTHQSTDDQCIIGQTSSSITFHATPWSNSNWSQINAALSVDTRLLALHWSTTTDGEIEIDIGVGAASSEQVVTTLRIVQHSNTSSSGMHYAWFPTGHCLSAGARVSARVRGSVSGNAIDLFLMGTENSGPGPTTNCGPGALSPSAANVVQLTGSPVDNEIARFDQNGHHIQGSGIFIPDGASDTLSGTNTGDQTITLTGDVTGSGTGSFAATIANDAVTYAKMQNISAASRLLGRGSAAGAGDPQEISLGSGLSMSGTTLSAATGAADVYERGITIDGGGAAITTGVKGFITIPVTGTITKATLLSTDPSATAGDIVIDVWKDTYANYPPDNADSITASAPPTLSSANKSQDSTLTGWTTAVTAGDILGFNVDSATTVTRVTLILTIQP